MWVLTSSLDPLAYQRIYALYNSLHFILLQVVWVTENEFLLDPSEYLRSEKY